MSSESQQRIGSAGLIGVAALGGAVVGFVLQLLVAYYFGASADTDAYFMAQSTSELMSKLLLGGSLAAVFLPIFVERLAQNKREEAWHLGLNLLHLTGAAFALLIIVLAIFAAPFVRFIAPGFDATTAALTVSLLRILLPSFLLLFLVEVMTSMLHALKHFTIPASLRIVAPTISIIAIVTLAPTLGIFALAVGAVAGSIVQVTLIFGTLQRQGFSYRFVFQPADPVIRRLLFLVYPFIFSVLVSQGAGIVYRILVSDLTTGSLTALKFAEKITQLLTIMFLGSVTIVTFPLMSEKAARGDMAGLTKTIGEATRLIVFVSIPLIVAIVLLREPLIRLLFERGSFSPEDTALTSVALFFLVLGLAINGISSVLGHATLALKQTRAAVAVTIASQAIAAGLFVLLVPRMAHAGLALGSSLTPIAIALLYYLYLTRFLPDLHRVFWHYTYAKTLVLAVALAIVIVLGLRAGAALPLPNGPSLVAQVTLPSIVGIITYFGGAYLWGVEEVHQVWGIARRKLARLLPGAAV